MATMTKTLFIINPISGGRDKSHFEHLIYAEINRANIDYSILYTKAPQDARLWTQKALKEGYDMVVAVGGDGTINEVASQLVGQACILGIVPFGSGNGLARSLNIPLHPKKALRLLNNARCKTIDVGMLNEQPFFNVAGVGFEARVSHLFQTMKGRGVMGYAKTIVNEFTSHQAQKYIINQEEYRAYSISFANSSQYGNNMHIAPLALLDDGWLDVVVIKEQSKFNLPFLGLRMYNKSLHKSTQIVQFKTKNIIISREKDDYVHLDGESMWMKKELKLRVIEHGLKVMIP